MAEIKEIMRVVTYVLTAYNFFYADILSIVRIILIMVRYNGA